MSWLEHYKFHYTNRFIRSPSPPFSRLCTNKKLSFIFCVNSSFFFLFHLDFNVNELEEQQHKRYEKYMKHDD